MVDDPVVLIKNRYEFILGRISRLERHDPPIHLVVVTKSQPLALISAAYEAGIRCFGENYADEAVHKIQAIPRAGVEWHMIGHVQSRKADLVAEHFSMLHSLDRIKIAQRLELACEERDRILPVLIEVNISGEASKFGFAAWDRSLWENLRSELDAIIQMRHLQIRGLMTMPPYSDNPENARSHFRNTRLLRDYLAVKYPEADWSHLSMGTSADYEVALEEGATYIRIGEAIMGARVAERKIG